MRVYEAIGETLKKLEVQATFGLMGDGNLRFMTHLAHELGMPYYAARHEGGAVAMADGYARVTGRVGVCSVTQGPGVTNTLTALTEARKASTPMLLLAGDTAARGSAALFTTGPPVTMRFCLQCESSVSSTTASRGGDERKSPRKSARSTA